MKITNLFFVIVLIVTIVFAGCKKEPGPISVENDLSPLSLNHGDYINWKITVNNLGKGEAEIERIHCREEFISGYFVGQYVELDLPLSNNIIEGKATETIYSQSSSVINTSTTDAIVRNTITVYSNGGNDTDETTYTIKPSNNKDGVSGEIQSCKLKIDDLKSN